MTEQVQVEQRLRDLANQIDPTMVGGRDAALLLEAADRLATLQRQDERVRAAFMAGWDAHRTRSDFEEMRDRDGGQNKAWLKYAATLKDTTHE